MKKIICVVSTKGGSGKSTLAMLLASAGIAKGLKVHCFDGDQDPQLIEWRAGVETHDRGGKPAPDWPEHLLFSKLEADLDAVDEQLNTARELSDLVIIDTRPGTHEDTEDIAYSADAILIPSRVNAADTKHAIDTFIWMAKLKKAFCDEESHPAIRLVLNDLSNSVVKAVEDPDNNGGKLTYTDITLLNRIFEMPFLNTPIPRSRVIENLPLHGPLTAQIDAFDKSSDSGLQKRSARRVLNIATAILDEVLQTEREANG